MRMGQGVRTGLGHGGITCVLQTQFSSFKNEDNKKVNKSTSLLDCILNFRHFIFFDPLEIFT